MVKPTAKSTVKEMKDYIRTNDLNKAPIRIGMKRADLIAGLRKLGHYDSRHDKPGAKAPVQAIADRPAQAPARKKKPAPKKEPVDRVRRTRLTQDFQRQHKQSVWKVLGIKSTATRQQVKDASRSLMRKNHPDKGGNTATFQKIQEATKILMDTFGPVRAG